MFHKNIVLLSIAISLVTFASYTAQAQNQPLAIVTDGLVSYWPLDEVKKGPKGANTVEDIVGDNDGVLQHKQKVVKGKYGNALEFDGLQDFVIVGTNNFPLGNTAVTISAWIFKDRKGVAGQHLIFSYGVWDTGSPGHGVFTFAGQRRLNNVIGFSQGNNGEVRGPEIKLGEWNHVAAIYNGAKRNIIYLDGVEVVAEDVPEANVRLKAPDLLGEGAAIGSDTRHDGLWDGLVDEIGIYNRTLTPEEVKRNATAPQIFAVEPLGKLSLVWGAIKAAR